MSLANPPGDSKSSQTDNEIKYDNGGHLPLSWAKGEGPEKTSELGCN